MKLEAKRFSLSLVALCAASALLFTACEEDSNADIPGGLTTETSTPTGALPIDSKDNMSISPASAQATFAGQKITFSVTGGTFPITWSVAVAGSGSIATTAEDGREATYTASVAAQNTIIAQDRGGRTVQAEITASVSALSVTPKTLTTPAVAGNTIQYVATGGVEPYEFTSVVTALGAINLTSGLYTMTAIKGTNTIVVVDAKGSSSEATLIQN